MLISIIIPAYNEEKFISYCLDSMINQTRKPNELIIIDDNSTDFTYETALKYSNKYEWIKVFKSDSGKSEHAPGAKVVNTFYFGLSKIKNDYDLIGKFDADIILPKNYFEEIEREFQQNEKVGMCSGLIFIKDSNNHWVHENISDKSHIRGPIKLYSKKCFKWIDGLRTSIGWDSVDVLLANFYGFETKTVKTLHVKHLRPTWNSYKKKTKFLQGEALYRMRYGYLLSFLTALKMSIKQKDLKLLYSYAKGYTKASKKNLPFIVSKEEGDFIRKYRWKNIKKKFF